MGATPRTTPPHKVAARKKALHTIPTRVPGKVCTGAHRPTTHGYSAEALIATLETVLSKNRSWNVSAVHLAGLATAATLAAGLSWVACHKDIMTTS